MQREDALPELSERQRREIEYHKDHARQYAEKYRSIDFAVVSFTERRWWNAYWEMYRHIALADMHGRRALVVGCGFGHDAVLLAKLGAQVSAFDLSAELLAIGQDLAARYELNVDFQQMPAERLSYQDGEFDFVLIVDILHHCDVTKALSELARVSKPGATWVVDEIYTHSVLQRLRESTVIVQFVYPFVSRLLYGNKPYITDDERKLDERDVAEIRKRIRTHRIDYYYAIIKRFVPERGRALSKLDRLLLVGLWPIAPLLGGRFVMFGVMERSAAARSIVGGLTSAAIGAPERVPSAGCERADADRGRAEER
jgi:ubiquinone/menaquinone biosynthesis C-methylase UbiE